MASRNSAKTQTHKDAVINSLKDLFGNVLDIVIIRSVASQCDYDVQRSSNALLEMSNNVSGLAPKSKIKKSPQQSPNRLAPRLKVKSKKTLEQERVVSTICQGFKVLVILRGLPGSGKSTLAKSITDKVFGPGDNSAHILSADDYFSLGGRYFYEPAKVPEAHEWNQKRAFQAMSRGLSPVIIDNTNTQMWEMKAYAMMATDYGYMIEILEPDTPWAFNDKELAKKNVHNVNKQKIKDMILRYDKNVSPQKLLLAYNLTYKFQKPPQYRLIPPVVQNGYRPEPQEGVVKSKSTPQLYNRPASPEVINLMDFSDDSNQELSSQGYTDDPDFYSNPVDDILMYTEDSSSDILIPNQVAEEPKCLFPDVENAWGIDAKALQSWDIVTPINGDSPSYPTSSSHEESPPDTCDGSSSVERGDYLREGESLPVGARVVEARGRDINEASPTRAPSIPKKTMIDQSSTTDDLVDGDSDESRIKDLLDLFPRIPKASLQELFNKCNKNFHWTVDLLLDDDNLEVSEGVEVQEEEEEVAETVEEEVEVVHEEPKDAAKIFKRKTVSDDSWELKRCLEERIDFNKEHYSDHVFKVKQTRFGGYQEPQPSTSAISENDSDSDESSQSDEDPKNMIELNLGENFVQQLETVFGGDDTAFPKGFQPVVQMPVALARQIYSFYIESLCQQMETQNHILDRLVKEDEEFARKLQYQEDTPQRPPNLTEIMDEQIAMNIHRRDVDEWKNMTADNLAARLTKQKLFSTFPNVDRDALLEIWHAYDYDYNKTVEEVMASVGQNSVVGGVEAVKEPPVSQATLKEMKEAEERCVDIEGSEEEKPATYYREEANKHLRQRSDLYEKARKYHQRGMTEVAVFYSELAQKETKLYDKANHLAAAVYIEEHAKRLQKFDTLDLHYFYVKEAIANLDIFIDRNINLLKGGTKRGQDLFVITGRGKNSEGGKSKIKPAVMSRLKKRKIGFVQLNPGLLKIRVMSDSPMTSDVP